MKLTENQIEKLYQFTRQHYVEWYDVQTELVDHLANGIEQQWEENPNVSFDDALQNEFKKFGVFGFMDLLEQRTKSLNKKYLKLVWSMFKQYFKIPQILSIFALFSCIYLSFKWMPEQDWVYIAIGISFFIVMMVKLYQLNKIKKARFKKTNKKWLLEEQILGAGNVGSFGYLFLQIPMHFNVNTTSEVYICLISFIITCFIVINYIMIFVLPSKVDELLEKQYPEYNLQVKV